MLKSVLSDPGWSQADAAWVTAFIAFWGLMFTGFAANYARKAYEQAKRQADVASLTLLQAKRQADAGDKAWLTFEAISLSSRGNTPNFSNQTQDCSYIANFQITNYGKVPARIVSVSVEIIAPAKLDSGGPLFDAHGNLSSGYTKADDGGSINYELADRIIPADPLNPIKAEHNNAMLTYTISHIMERHIRVKFLWLRIRYSDPSSDERELASLFMIPVAGRTRLVTEDKAHTYLR